MIVAILRQADFQTSARHERRAPHRAVEGPQDRHSAPAAQSAFTLTQRRSVNPPVWAFAVIGWNSSATRALRSLGRGRAGAFCDLEEREASAVELGEEGRYERGTVGVGKRTVDLGRNSELAQLITGVRAATAGYRLRHVDDARFHITLLM
ncbi:hypothetical protein [Streptomyces sp. NPDC094049]|uniref:hypothetical protein n=1 Tax=Streptomyces sp. NPDC094049 TaxID=3154987 RepID=UPI00331CD7DF